MTKNEWLTNLLVMAVLVLFSGYFSATETAFSALNRTRLRARAEKGNRRAALTLKIAEDYNKMLSTILVGNNIVNIALASLGTVFFVRLYGDRGATISTVVITLVVLIFGEITPKSAAKDMPERFAMFSAPFLRLCIWVLTPVNAAFGAWKKLISRLMHSEKGEKMTQDELLLLVDEVQQGGSIDNSEHELLRNAIEFTDRVAEDILTHRVDLEGVSLTAAREEIAAAFSRTRFSRLPVYDGNIDRIVGVLHQKDFYENGKMSDRPISELMTEPVFVTKSQKISELLALMQKKKSHISVVIDEYGGTLGIVTMEDILEELVGEIWDEHEEAAERIRIESDGSYSVDCSVPLDEFCKFFAIEPDGESNSVSGWVSMQLGKLPEDGDRFENGPWDICVVSTESRRAEKLSVLPIKTEPKAKRE